MNKSLLLIICDFLLLSLLGFVNFDLPNEGPLNEGLESMAENQKTDASQDLIEALEISLEQQKQAQTSLVSDLSSTEQEIAKQAADLKKTEEELRLLALEQKEVIEEKQKLSRDLAEARQSQEDQEVSLKKAEKSLEIAVKTADELLQTNQTLQSEMNEVNLKSAELERNTDKVVLQLNNTITEKARIEDSLVELQSAKMKEEQKKLELLEKLNITEIETLQLQSRLSNVEKQKTDVEQSSQEEILEQIKITSLLQQELQNQRKQALVLQFQLEAADKEKDQLRQSLAQTQEQVSLERQERQILHKQTERLSENVSELVLNTGDIKKEVKDLQALTCNEIYQTFSQNKVKVQLKFELDSLFGDRSKNFKMDTILLKQGNSEYLLFNTVQTPLEPNNYNNSVLSIEGTLIAGNATSPITKIGFLKADPRIAVIPISERLTEASQLAIYPISQNPFSHSTVAIVNSEKKKFGETTFQIEPEHPHFLKMDSRILSKLFGDFSPSVNDLVFTLKGEFLGIMGNNKFALKSTEIEIQESMSIYPSFNVIQFLEIHKSRMKRTNNLEFKFK